MYHQLRIRRPEVRKRINFGDTKQKNNMLDAFRLCHSSPETPNVYLTKEAKDSSHHNADCSQNTALRIV